MASSLSEKNRKATLKKKASELSALCGVDVFMVIFGSDGNMEVWPNDTAKAKSTISNYYEAITKPKPNNYDLKLSESDQPPLKKKKMELQIQTDYTKLENLSNDSLVGLSDYLETKIQNLDKKINESLMINERKEIQVYKEDHEEEEAEERVEGFWSDILNMLDQESSLQPSFPFGYVSSSSINGGDDWSGAVEADFGYANCCDNCIKSGFEEESCFSDPYFGYSTNELGLEYKIEASSKTQELEESCFCDPYFGYSTNELGLEYKIEGSSKRQKLEESCFCDPYFGYFTNELGLEYKIEAASKRQKLEDKIDFVGSTHRQH